MHHSGDIRTQVEVGLNCKKLHCPSRTPEDDDTLSVDLNQFSMHESNVAAL